MPIAARGRPGHERGATPEFLLRRRIHFRLRYGLTVNLPMHRQVRFDDQYVEMIHYDTELMRQLASRPGISFIPFPYFLDDYVQKLADRTPRRLLADYVDFRVFYFAFNADPQRLSRYRDALLAAGIQETQLRDAERVAQQTLAAAGLQP
jgi:hypothetical protein